MGKTYNERAQELVDAARAQLGTPWSHQGRIAGKNLDCVGLVLHAAKCAGAIDADFDYTNYRRESDEDEMRMWLDTFCYPVRELNPGDVLWLRVRNQPAHLAIYSGNDTIIHSTALHPRRVVEEPYTVETRADTVAMFRLRGLRED